MNYKDYTFQVDTEKLYPPLPGGKSGEYHFAAKVIYMWSPNGEILWKYGSPIPEKYGRNEAEAEDNAFEAAKKWIDSQES